MSPSPPPPVATIPSVVLSVLTAVSSFRTDDEGDPAQPSKWRQRIVQFDVSHNAMALAFFAFTATLNIATRIGFPIALSTFFFILSSFVLALCLTLTAIRTIIYPDAIRQDFGNPRLINFFFLPAIIAPIVLLTLPPPIRMYNVSQALFYVFFVYQLALSLHTYGQWLHVSNPVASVYPLLFMQTIAFFLLSILASTLNLTDQAVFLLVPGILFWLVIFVTVFQHMTPALKSARQSPNPIFFLFLAPPAQATIAILTLQAARLGPMSNMPPQFLRLPSPLPWTIHSEIALYVDLFIYALLLRLLPTWLDQSFSVVWWAYVFPMSGAASAIILRYEAHPTLFWKILASVALAMAASALLIVSLLTLRGAWRGDFPKNAGCQTAYLRHYMNLNEKKAYANMSSSSFSSFSSSVTEEV
ncbi:S-type anion channel SLAH2 [Gracilariopsis chorda]|uniref:S-type anion channel SLAH2 n=1 Tax=Gracilariopsis chorda TaxID=448386 RepID=A0A2V3IX87_9FLOR|nr:S-type anion channel SLAH2 [Gracilariopsis chorda]|eukprot:PXF46774.1 S-type anion channel SLAH2 [Gracilariopsis chorda]